MSIAISVSIDAQNDEYSFPCLCESGRSFDQCCLHRVLLSEDKLALVDFAYTKSQMAAVTFDTTFVPIIWAEPRCGDCGGPCEWVNVPNRVWSSLGLSKEFMCVKCISHRIDP